MSEQLKTCLVWIVLPLFMSVCVGYSTYIIGVMNGKMYAVTYLQCMQKTGDTNVCTYLADKGI